MNLGEPNENDSNSFQGIQHHYNTISTKSQVIYLPLFRYFSAISLDFPCRICHNNYVIKKKRENMRLTIAHREHIKELIDNEINTIKHLQKIHKLKMDRLNERLAEFDREFDWPKHWESIPHVDMEKTQ